MNARAYYQIGDTPEQIVEAYPTLTLAQVHDVLGYYHDHPGEIEGYIRENREAQWRMKQRMCRLEKVSSNASSNRNCRDCA